MPPSTIHLNKSAHKTNRYGVNIISASLKKNLFYLSFGCFLYKFMTPLNVHGHLSEKDLSFLHLLGCLSFLSALASIWRILSRVTLKKAPTSSRVWSFASPMPNLILKTFSSRGARVERTSFMCAERALLIISAWRTT